MADGSGPPPSDFEAKAAALVAWVSPSVLLKKQARFTSPDSIPPPLSHFTFYLPRPNHQQANTFEPPPSQQQQAVVTGSLAELSDGVRVAEMLHDMYVNPLAGRQAGG